MCVDVFLFFFSFVFVEEEDVIGKKKVQGSDDSFGLWSLARPSASYLGI